MEIAKPFEITSLKELDIRPVFPIYNRLEGLKDHLNKCKQILSSLIPTPLPFKDQQSLEKWLQSSLPMMRWNECSSPPSSLTISFLSKPLKMISTETFLQEMLKRWLIPFFETTILSFDHMLFYFDHYLKEPFFVAQAVILIKNTKEFDMIRSNLPRVKGEIIHGIKSGHYAKALLETKALPLDGKLFLVRESLMKLMHRFPDDFDSELLRHFAYTQTHVTDDFKSQHSYLHLARMIVSLYLIQNRIEREVRTLPEKRHVFIRFLHTELSFPFGVKPVLALTLTLNFFHSLEFFGEKHIQLSVQKFFPNMRIVTGSFYEFELPESSSKTFYIELEKEDGSQIHLSEAQILRKHLPDELKKRVEHLVPSLFMVCNEEEMMHNILLLSQEQKTPKDIPQMLISFDQHSQEDLLFTVVYVRVKKDEKSILERIKNVDPDFKIIPDRIQVVRYLNQVYPIEATVFKVQITKQPAFLRMDFSVNLYLARQEVVLFLKKYLGETRDYNGGVVLKQGELLSQLKRLFQDSSNRDQELLENFFYSLDPIEAQASTSLESLSVFFELLLKQIDKPFPEDLEYDYLFEQTKQGLFLSIRLKDGDYHNTIRKHLAKNKILSSSFVFSKLSHEGIYHLNYFYPLPESKEQDLFKQSILTALTDYNNQKKSLKTLRLAIPYFVSIDPRIGGDQETSVIIKMLFDGLMHLNNEGRTEPAIAESFTISEDGKEYQFKLKETYWSDGSKLIAYDFEYAWKKILSPNFSTPFSSIFSPIVNAEAAKKGDVPLSEVGINAIDDRTLVVTLNHPTPYFLELTANTFYSPINHRIDQMHPNWATLSGEHFVCNGGFCVKRNGRSPHKLELERNPYYWDKDQIYLDKISIAITSIKQSIEMFKEGHIDFLGSPLQPSAECFSDKENAEFMQIPLNKVKWLSFNTEQFPLNNVNMRKALAYSINKEIMLTNYEASEFPASTILPYSLTQKLDSPYAIKHNVQLAKKHFDLALEELGLSKDEIPLLPLIHTKREVTKNVVTSIALQWEETLGIKCLVEEYKFRDLFEKMTSGEFVIGMINWISWLTDPMYTLNAFRNRNDKVNFSKWDYPQFKSLLDAADKELDIVKRKQFLADAEEILLDQVPTVPISYEKSRFIRNPNFSYPSRFFLAKGNPDFTRSFFKKETK